MRQAIGHIDTAARLRARGVCVVIPTYNNASTIGAVVRSVLEYCHDVIVVNDGSTDGTDSVLGQIEGISVVTLERNRGKGYALREGFEAARKKGFGYAITMDGDGQHYAKDIATMLRANERHPGALIIGRRRMDEVERSSGSRFANKFSNFWFWVQTGLRVDDTQSGYRLYPLRRLHGLSLLTSRYEAEVELLVMAAWHGVEIVSEDVDVYYPPEEERVSHFRPAADFGRISMLNTVLCFLAIVYGLPLRLYRTIRTLTATIYTLMFFVVGSTLVMAPCGLALRLKRRGEESYRRLILKASRITVRGLFRWPKKGGPYKGIPGARIYVKGADAVGEVPSVIICNHQAYFDLMCQLIMTSKMVFMTNDWVWNSPFFGKIIRRAGYLHAGDGIDVLMPKMRRAVENGCSIAIYPEGTRSVDMSIGRFHQGAFHIAQELGLPITPMYIYGMGRILGKGRKLMSRGPVVIEVGEPISRAELSAMGDELAQARELRRRYTAKIREMSDRIERNG